MSLSTSTPVVAKKPGPAKKTTKHSYKTVDKNTYTKGFDELVAQGAKIIAVTVNPDVRNSFDIHYSILEDAKL